MKNKFLYIIILFSLLSSSSVFYAQKKTRILFIFDASNSMTARWQKSTKMEIAQKLMKKTMQEIQKVENLEVALRVYGHQVKIQPGQQDCEDTKLEVPFDKDNFNKIKNKIQNLIPQGTTPIARSLMYATEDFTPCDDCNDVIILITDGIEACDEDPCAVAKALREKGIEVRPYVIGVAMDTNSLHTFDCIGKTYDANTETSFENILKVVVNEALNNTKLVVKLYDINNKPRETNVLIDMYDRNSKELIYSFYHTFDIFNKPDTIIVSPVYDYDIVINTTPISKIENYKLKASEINILEKELPQGELELSIMGNKSINSQIKIIVKDTGTHEVINVQNINSIHKYLCGTYDIEFLTLPRKTFENIKIENHKTNELKIPESGIANIILPSPGNASIYEKNGSEWKWIYNLDMRNSIQQIIMLPGKYKVVYRSSYKYSSAYTISKEFEIDPVFVTDVLM